MPKVKKEVYRNYAESKGLSLTALIIQLLKSDMQKSDYNS